MKLSHLLAGVAAAALTAGAANAQSLLLQGDVGPANTSGTPPTTGDAWFASEIGGLAGVTVPFEFELEPEGGEVFASSPNVEGLLTVTVTSAVLDRSLIDADIVGTGVAGACPDAELTVDANGGAGDNTVTFRIADLADCDAEDQALTSGGAVVQFAFPLVLSGGDVDVSYELRRASNNALITSGSWTDGDNNGSFGGDAGDPLVTQISAIEVDFDAGIAVADSTATPAYSTLASAALGSFAIDVSGALLASGVAAATSDVDDAELLCTFGSVAGLDQSAHGFGGLGNGATTSTSNPVSFSIPITQFGSTNTLALSSLATVGIQPQTVTCAGTVEFSAASGLSDFTIASTPIGRIRRDGPTTGFFEWVGDSAQAVSSVFRITGLGATAPGASIIVNNSTTGLDGEYSIALPTPTNGEVIINSAQLTTAAGNFGRGDVQFSFQNDDLENTSGDGVIVRRFMVSPNGTLFDMGNDNDDDTNERAGDVGPSGDAGGGDN